MIQAKPRKHGDNSRSLLFIHSFIYFSFLPSCEIKYRLHVPIRLFSSSLLRQFSPSIFSTSHIWILFTHTCFSLTSIINSASLPDNIPRADVTEQSYNRSRSAFRGLDGLILVLHAYAKPTTSCRCTQKKNTNANQSQSWTQGQISISASPSI